MRIQPVKRYAPPPLPLTAWNEADPAVHRERCGRVLRLMAGLGLFGAAAMPGGMRPAAAGESSPGVPRDPPPAPGGITDSVVPAPPAEAAKAFLRVAPNLLDAMAREGLGRGAAGCVAVSPPSFVSEADGVAILRAELEKAGLVLAKPAEKGPTVRGVVLPRTSTQRHLTGNSRQPPLYQEAPADFTFDGATADGRVVFEFVSQEDFAAWEKPGELGSTLSTWDMVPPAQRLADNLAKVPDAGRRIVLLVCDPVYSTSWTTPTPDGITPEEHYARQVKAAHEKAARQIRGQLMPQLRFLAEQGLLDPAAVDAYDRRRIVDDDLPLGADTREERRQAHTFAFSFDHWVRNRRQGVDLNGTMLRDDRERAYLSKAMREFVRHAVIDVRPAGAPAPSREGPAPKPDIAISIYETRDRPADPAARTQWQFLGYINHVDGEMDRDHKGSAGMTFVAGGEDGPRNFRFTGPLAPLLAVPDVVSHPAFRALKEPFEHAYTVHTVARGDTLVDLVRRRTGDRSERAWRDVARLNRAVLPHPDRLTVGMPLLVPWVAAPHPSIR